MKLQMDDIQQENGKKILGLRSMITESIEKSKSTENHDLVLMIGATGAGKSTLTNYLMNFPMDEDDEGKAIPQQQGTIPPAEMGNSMDSVTTYPSAIFSSHHNLVYCDCPGFNDTRGSEQRVCISVTLEHVVNHAKSIRAVIAVIDSRAIDTERGAAFKDIAMTLGRLFKNGISPDSLVFVFSHANDLLKNGTYKVKKETIDRKVAEMLDKLWTDKIRQEERVKHQEQVSNHSDQDFLEAKKQLTEIELRRNVLFLMKENKNNVIIARIFDNGESRNEILQAISRSKGVDKESFDFSDADNDRILFRLQIMSELVQGLSKMKALYRLPREKAAYETAHQEATNNFNTYSTQLQDIKSGRAFLGKDDPIVIENEKTKEKNEGEKADLEDAISKEENEKKAKEREYYSLDTSDPVEAWSDHYKKGSRFLKSFGYGIGGFGFKLGDQAAASETKTEDKVFMGLVGFAAGLVASPFRATYELCRRYEFDITYPLSIPFIEAKEKYTTGSVTSRNENAAEGIYNIHYKSDRFGKAEIEVDILVEKRNIPDVKAKIQEIKEEIECLERNINEKKERSRELSLENKKVEALINSFLQETELNKRQREIELNQLKEAQGMRVKELETKIGEKQREFNETKQVFSEAVKSYQTYLDISDFVNPNTEEYPHLVRDVKAYLSSIQSNKAEPLINNERPQVSANSSVPLAKSGSSFFSKNKKESPQQGSRNEIPSSSSSSTNKKDRVFV